MGIRKIVNRIIYPHTCDNEHFIKYLRKNGAAIGNGTRFIDPKRCSVDPGRLDYISIGDNCCLSVVSIIAHDYSWYIMRDAYGEILPDPGGEIAIGNNCFIGYETCILKNTTIGDNVIIAARSVVKGNVPSNTVYGGVPAKQICTLDELYEKRKKLQLKDAKYRKDHLMKKNGSVSIKDTGYFAYLFLERTQENYQKYIAHLEHNGIKNSLENKKLFFNSNPLMSFEEFIKM